LSSSLLRLFVNVAWFFEPVSPRFVSFWVRRRLRDWKNRGLIDRYSVKTKRAGKFHYKVSVDLDLTPEQVDWVLRDALVRIAKRVGR
jgi:hypothetical protein